MRKGGRQIFANCRRGVQHFFDIPKRGGEILFDFVNYFPNVLKRHFLLFLRHFGHIYFFCLRGGENFSRRREGGAKIFRSVIKGGRKNFARRLFWIP